MKEEPATEKLRNPLYIAGKVRFSAVSTGCTVASDFAITHAVNHGRCELEISRTQPDLCRKASELVDIELDWEPPTDCNDREVVFTNPDIGDIQQLFTRELPSE